MFKNILLAILLALSPFLYGAQAVSRDTVALGTLSDDANGICEDQTTSGAAALSLDGVLVSGGTATTAAEAQQVSIEGSGNNSTITFTLVGTGPDNKAETEVLTGSNGGTATSARWYRTITGITASGAVTGDVEVGWLSTNGAVTKTIIPKQRGYSPAFGIFTTVTGTMVYTVEHTGHNMPSSIEPTWFDTVGLVAKTASDESNIMLPVGGVRGKVTSYTSGTFEIMIVQSRAN